MSTKLPIMCIGSAAIGVICGILHPPQPASLLLTFSFSALWACYVELHWRRS